MRSFEAGRGLLYALERSAVATRAERVVKRFLSTPGWKSGTENLRLAHDNVKREWATATQQMSASGRKPTSGSDLERMPGDGVEGDPAAQPAACSPACRSN